MSVSDSYWRERKFVYPLMFLFIAGGALRLSPTLLADFPLNDGGLFSVMIQNILDADFTLPYFTTYNGGDIPYGYPPLAFYLTAFLSRLFGISVINLVHYLPCVIAILTIPVFYGFCRVFPLSRREVWFAVLCFAFTPRTYKWLIMGGGITRAFGVLFAIFALRQIVLLYQEPTAKRNLILTIFFSSLTILVHAETGWFVAYSALIIFLFSQKNKAGIVSSLLVALGVAAFTSIWWAVLIDRHGLATFTAAWGSGYGGWYTWLDIMFDFADESYISFFTVIAIIGFFISIKRREFLFPAWFMSVFLITPRSGSNFAVIPMAFLFSSGLDRGVIPALKGVEGTLETRPQRKLQLPVANIFLVFLALYTFLAAFPIPVELITSFDHVLLEEREAMSWVHSNTDPDSTFLVITSKTSNKNVWIDQVSEWFPVLAQRTSLAAVQGYEWLPGQMDLRRKQYYDLQGCATQNLNCIDRWADKYQLTFTHIYLSKVEDGFGNSIDCCYPLRIAIEDSSDYDLIFDGPGATIFERQDD